jgi:para-aminobenzoate synthetase component 1
MKAHAPDKSDKATPAVYELSFSADELLRALLSLSPHRRLSLLDSCGAPNPSARYLIAGFDPFKIIEARGDRLAVTESGQVRERAIEGDALSELDKSLDPYKALRSPVESLPVAGACIATFSYDLIHQLERLRSQSKRPPMDEPDVALAFYDTLVVHDYWQGRTNIIGVGNPARLEATVEALNEARSRAPLVDEWQTKPLSKQVVTSNFTRDEYLAAVRRIKEHIAAGDIYQANLTQQLSCALSKDCRVEDVFLRLRRDHPASFAAFIRRGDDTIISASPERFLRVQINNNSRQVEAWPIKGTRPHGRNLEEDARLRAELLASVKDRAENIMIVDLMRNDLGRVCQYGSIEVTELCSLEEYPTLFHLVSKVRGSLREEVTAGALLRAAFPCGSITGAPKIRAMEIIAETETVPRGLSMGAIGYFSFDGSLDLNVAIRTMVVRDYTARFNVGGGIVADSSPALEYEESLTKARALLVALGVES